MFTVPWSRNTIPTWMILNMYYKWAGSAESLLMLIASVKPEHFLYHVMLPFAPLARVAAERRRSCPLRSSLGRPDCAYKAGRKQGEVNSGQAVLRAVKQLAVWLKTTQSWNVNISEGLALHSALAASAAAWLDLGARSGWRRRFMCKETCWKSWFPNGVLFSRKNTY